MSFVAKIVEDYLPNFLVVVPYDYHDNEDGGEFRNQYKQAIQLARHPWHEEEFGGRKGVATIWDTVGEMSWGITRYVATTGLGGVKDAPLYGDVDPSSPEAYRAHRFQDYQDGQGMTLDVMKAALRNQNLHTIMISHRDEKTTSVRRGGEIQTTLDGYGFQTIGSKHTLTVGKLFNEYIWLENRAYESDDPEIWAHVRPDHLHQGKLRTLDKDVEDEFLIPFELAGMQEAWLKLFKWSGVTAAGPGRKAKAGLYAPSGWGKTTWATALPQQVFDAGYVVYIAYDPGSEFLPTTWPQLRGEGPSINLD